MYERIGRCRPEQMIDHVVWRSLLRYKPRGIPARFYIALCDSADPGPPRSPGELKRARKVEYNRYVEGTVKFEQLKGWYAFDGPR